MNALSTKRQALIRLLDPPFDKMTHRSRLHQRLLAGRARKWWAVHARRLVVDHGLRRVGRRGRELASCSMLSRPVTAILPRPSPFTRSSRMSSPPTCMVRLRTSAAAGGRGTRARRVGCAEREWSGSSGSGCAAPCSTSIPASRGRGGTSSCVSLPRVALRDHRREPARGVARHRSLEVDGVSRPVRGTPPTRRRWCHASRSRRTRLSGERLAKTADG